MGVAAAVPDLAPTRERDGTGDARAADGGAMRILLARPYLRDRTYLFGPPLGLMALAAYLRAKTNCLELEIYDARLGAGTLGGRLAAFRPHLVGCTGMSYEHRELERMAATVKRLDRRIPLILGGPHATAFPEEILRSGNVDLVVLGEGEATLLEIVERIRGGRDLRGIAGTARLGEDGTLVLGASRPPLDVDELPAPAWDLVDLEKHIATMSFNLLNKGLRPAPVFTSRGCPYHCVYCHGVFGKKFRGRSARNVVDEIRRLVDEYRIDEIMIFDDIFNFDRRRLVEICRLLIDERVRVAISFPNGMRGDLLDEELIVLLKQAGVYGLTVAVETASPRLQRLIRKGVDLDRIRDVIAVAYKHDLIMKVFFMIGFPTETLGEIERTIEFALDPRITIAGLLIANVHKNTELYAMAKRHFPGFEPDFEFYDYYKADPAYEKALGLPLRRIQRGFYLRFYLNPSRMMRIARLVPSLRGLLNGVRYFLGVIFGPRFLPTPGGT